MCLLNLLITYKAFNIYLNNNWLFNIFPTVVVQSITTLEILDKFTESWNNLSAKYSISTSPKLHIINYCLIDYFDLTEMPLRKISDELIENMHQFMHKRLRKGYWVQDTDNSSHGWKLLHAVKHINCYNLRIKKKLVKELCLKSVYQQSQSIVLITPSLRPRPSVNLITGPIPVLVPVIVHVIVPVPVQSQKES